jgi:hypothetical protein
MLGNQKVTINSLINEAKSKYLQLKLSPDKLNSSEIYSLVVLKKYQTDLDKALREGKLDGTDYDVESLGHLISSAAHDEIKNNPKLYDFLFDYAKQNPSGVDICSVWGRFCSNDIYAWGCKLDFERFKILL